MSQSPAAGRGPRADALDGDRPSAHLRCGSDIRAALNEAGFTGEFIEFADPYVQGPVLHGPRFQQRRARFIASAYGLDLAAVRARQRCEYAGLARASRTERVVLWFEHDSYDQLILAHVLHTFAHGGAPPALELICVDRFPGIERFIGLGQLDAQALRSLWPLRQRIGAAQLTLGSTVWLALGEPAPTALHAIAAGGTPALPLMAPALRRHLQELPWTGDGLSLTQRLVLQALRDGVNTGSAVFRRLMFDSEPLPFLGDLMFWHVLADLAAARPAPFEVDPATRDTPWPQRRLGLSPAGAALLEGKADFMTAATRARWVGGMQLRPGAPGWRWSGEEARPVPG